MQGWPHSPFSYTKQVAEIPFYVCVMQLTHYISYTLSCNLPAITLDKEVTLIDHLATISVLSPSLSLPQITYFWVMIFMKEH